MVTTHDTEIALTLPKTKTGKKVDKFVIHVS